MKRPLILTLVLAVLISTVCGTAAVSAAAPKQNPAIYVYTTPELTTAHLSANRVLEPFTVHGTSTFSLPSNAPSQSQQSSEGPSLRTSVTSVASEDNAQWGSSDAWLAPRFRVGIDDWTTAQDRDVTVIVKLKYTFSGSIAASEDQAVFYDTVTVTLGNGYAQQVAAELRSTTPGTYSETKIVTIPMTVQLKDLRYQGIDNDLGLTVHLESVAGAFGGPATAHAAGTVAVLPIQLEWTSS